MVIEKMLLDEKADRAFEDLLVAIAKRPAMYVGRNSLSAVGNYLMGFCDALKHLGCADTPLDGWMRWIELRFLISHSAWHWTRILLHAYRSDLAAIEALPILHTEFLAVRASLGIEGIEQELRKRLVLEYGQDWHQPSETSTVIET